MKTTWRFWLEKLHRKRFVEIRWIFLPSKLHRKSTWKNRGYFDQRNYTEKSLWKQRRFFSHLNYIEKRMWKRRRFFNQRNYIEKVRGIAWIFAETWSLMNRRNIHVESASIRCGVPVGILHKYKSKAKDK